jgi:hypothetical protein
MSSATPEAVTVGHSSGRDSATQAWSFETTDTPDSDGGAGVRPSDGIDGPMVIVRSAAGHEFVLTVQDLVMLSVFVLLFANTVLSVAEVFD